MKQLIGVVFVLPMTLLLSPVHGVATYNTGAGMIYKLGVTQDVTLESASRNYNWLQYLLVSKHPQYPNKRSLVQFENLPSGCPSYKIQGAKMYLYYVYAHKASWHTIQRTPFIPRFMQVYLVKKSWNEAEATSTKRDKNNYWGRSYLGLDNSDAERYPQSGAVTIFPYRPSGFVEFDITRAVRSWSNRVPNHGLLILATNELAAGRGIRFSSNAGPLAWRAHVLVLCRY